MNAQTRAGSEKRAEQIAHRIESSILVGANRTGDRLGTEDDLASTLNVSRWVMREAIAIMEMDGLVEIRRGKMGGIYVSVPAAALRIATLRHYYCLSGATGPQINLTRARIESQIANRAMRKLTLEDAQKLRRICRSPHGKSAVDISIINNALLHEILRISDQPALSMFSMALAQANVDRALWLGASDDMLTQLSTAVLDARIGQVEAIIAQDERAAELCLQDICDAGIALNRQATNPPEDLATAMIRASRLGKTFGDNVDEVKRVAKKPEAVARLIAQRIADQQFSTDGRVGSETEILTSLKVSRNVLREAIRMLERYGIVRVQRGVDGGVRAIQPDPASVIRATSLYLAPAYSLHPTSFHRLSLALQLEAVESIVANRTAKLQGDIAAYRDRLINSPARATRDEIFGYYEFLARSSGNPVLDCLMRSVIFQVDFGSESLDAGELAKLRQLQLQFLDHIEAGDAPMARRMAIELRTAGFSQGPVTRDSAKILNAD